MSLNYSLVPENWQTKMVKISTRHLKILINSISRYRQRQLNTLIETAVATEHYCLEIDLSKKHYPNKLMKDH